MDNSTPTHDATFKIRIGKLELGFNLVMQVLIWAILVGMVNYWSSRHFARIDVGLNSTLELSPQTKSILQNLQKPIKVIISFRGRAQVAEEQALLLLREYEFASKGKVTREIVDPDRDRGRMLELMSKYSFGESESVIILDHDGKHKFINSPELAEWDFSEAVEREKKGLSRVAPTMVTFKGEQVITSAILELTEAKQNKVYFVNGHGEHDYHRKQDGVGRTVNEFKSALTKQNVLHEALNLSEVDEIPEDAAALLILGPKLDYTERDLQLLSAYWEKKGHLIMCLGPAPGRFPKLTAWLAQRGVLPRNDDVIRIAMANTNVAQVLRAAVFAHHSPILRGVEGGGFPTEAPFQTFQLDLAKVQSGELRMTPLMVAPQGYWGETTPINDGTVPRFDRLRDYANEENMPLILGVQVEKGASADPALRLDAARLVIFGSGDMLTDGALDGEGGAAAVVVGLNAVNWIVGRENLIQMPPKTKLAQAFSLSSEQILNIALWVVVYIPLIIAVWGLYHLWWRYGKNLFVLTAWLAGIFLFLTGAWYLLLYWLDDPGAKTMPRNLIIALLTAVALGTAAIAIHYLEQKKRLSAQK